jgi:MYXO-CTERM domain-containing protein
VKKLFSLGLLLACVPAATAGPLSVTLNSLGAGANVTVQIVPVGSSGLQSFNAFAGVFNMTLNGQSFTSFCIDTSHEVHVGQTYSVTQTPVSTGLTYGAQMEYLYTKYLPTAVGNNTAAAALQIALWDLSDGGQSLLTGSTFRYTDTGSPIYTLANSYLAEALAYSPPSGNVGYWEDASPSGNALGRGQSLIGPPGTGFNPNVSVAPAPPAAFLALTGVVSLAGGRIFRRRTAA